MRAMKPRRPGSPHDALQRGMEEIGIAAGQGPESGAALAAAFEGVSVFTLYKQLDPDNEGTQLSWPRLWRLVDHFKIRAPVEALAALIGCRLVRLEKRGAADTDMRALISIAKESTDVLETGYAALADGRISPAERVLWRAQIGEAIDALLEMDARLEAGEGAGR